MRPIHTFAFASVTFVALSFVAARPAHAGLEACNNIDVSASAQCTVVTQGGCTTQCEPVRMQLACAGKLEAQCNGQCNAQADVSCSGSCKADCVGQCQANPGQLDCRASCVGRCEADCSGHCSSSSNQAECAASCKATCGGHCDAKCSGTPPSASCDAKCDASCNGSCEGKANIDCQVQCQSKSYAACEADLSGGCKTRCTRPDGALFCDGQYVDAGDNLQKCIDALNAILNVKVQASGSAQCANNECTAEGNATASCVASPSGAPIDPRVLACGVGTMVVAWYRRRSRKSA